VARPADPAPLADSARPVGLARTARPVRSGPRGAAGSNLARAGQSCAAWPTPAAWSAWSGPASSDIGTWHRHVGRSAPRHAGHFMICGPWQVLALWPIRLERRGPVARRDGSNGLAALTREIDLALSAASAYRGPRRGRLCVALCRKFHDVRAASRPRGCWPEYVVWHTGWRK